MYIDQYKMFLKLTISVSPWSFVLKVIKLPRQHFDRAVVQYHSSVKN